MMYLVLTCRFVVGLTFLVAAGSKVRGPAAWRRFRDWVAGLPAVPPAAATSLSVAVVAAEVGIVALLVPSRTVAVGLWLAATVLVGFTAGTVLLVKRGAARACACFGHSD